MRNRPRARPKNRARRQRKKPLRSRRQGKKLPSRRRQLRKTRHLLLRQPNLPTTLFGCGPISLRNDERDYLSPGIPRTTGSRRAVSCSKKPANSLSRRGFATRKPASQSISRSAPTERCRYTASIPGKHSFTFSIRRLMANGFGISPRTPASCSNSWARFSSPLPVTRRSGGTIRGGMELL